MGHGMAAGPTHGRGWTRATDNLSVHGGGVHPMRRAPSCRNQGACVRIRSFVMNSEHCPHVVLALLLVAASSLGCDQPRASGEGTTAGERAQPGAMISLTGASAEALSTSGAPVLLTLSRDTVQVGEVGLTVQLGEHREHAPTLDLVSPTMPMHGVIRYAMEQGHEGSYATTVQVPMEGRWAVYVNLDAGSDAAWFEFDARSGAAEPQAASHIH